MSVAAVVAVWPFFSGLTTQVSSFESFLAGGDVINVDLPFRSVFLTNRFRRFIIGTLLLA